VTDFERQWDQLPARPRYEEAERRPRSAVFVPLLARGQAIGVMAIQSDRPGAFRESDMRLLSVIASLAAGAIQNTHWLDQERALTKQLQLIDQVTRQLTAIQSLPDLFRQIVGLVHDVFGYYAVSVFMLDRAAGHMRLGASSHPNLLGDQDVISVGMGMIGWAAAHAEIAHAPDVTQDERYLALVEAPNTRAEVAVPLIVDERVLGVLDVQADRVDAFDENDLHVLRSLAGQLAMAIQEAATYDAERRQADRLATMVEASRAMVSILNVDDLMDEVVELAVDFFGFDRVHLFVCSGDRLAFRAGSGVHGGLWEIQSLSYDLDDPNPIAKAARLGEAVVLNDVLAEPGYEPGPGVEDTRAQVSVPIQIGESLLGVFDVQSLEPGVFTDEDVTLMQALADSIAVALRNASLYAVEQRRRVLTEMLRQVGTGLASSLDPEEVLDGILLALERVVGYDVGFILLYDEREAAYRIRGARGLPDETIGGLIRLEADDDVRAEIMWWLHELAGLRDDERTHSTVMTPLAVRGDQIGYLVVDRQGREGFLPDDEAIIEAFAAQVAVAIANAQLFEAQQEEAWVTAALLQVAEAVNRETDIDATLETVARLTPLLAGVYRCGIMSWDEALGCFVGRLAYGLTPDAERTFEGLRLYADDSPFARVVAKDRQVVVGGAGGTMAMPPLVGHMFACEALVGTPLVAKGDLLGLMLVDYTPAANEALDERRFNVLMGIAHQIALAMEAARLQAEANERQRLERELEVARQIQASFLPERSPQIAGWEVAAFYRAARQVGGDFYDFFLLPDGAWGMVVADVADKGVPAALFMALTRTLIRVAAMSRTSPAETLTRVNELVIADSHADMFVTVFYLVLDPETGVLRYATGGHNPPLCIQAGDGAAEMLSGRGLAVGVLDGVTYDEFSRDVEPGDVVVLYTDGVTEALDSHEEEFGVDRLVREAQGYREHTAADIVSHIVSAVDAFASGESQFDDLTLVVLKRLNGAPRVG
jgi:serine phosphatase RsbU (regulator of sigma subunit)/putative methionine-R-sulfoxide reductase with GAF domain